MIDDVVVVEGVAHSFKFSDDNLHDLEIGRSVSKFLYQGHVGAAPDGYAMPWEWFRDGDDVDLVASALFAESPNDLAVYHETPIYGYFKNGGSPLYIGEALAERWPGRVMFYGGITPFQHDALDMVDALAERGNILGLKTYPADLYHRRLQSYRLDDPEIAHPIYERALERGFKVIAVHKAIPLGPVPSDPFRVGDIHGAALDFPDLTFEVVHGGFAFVEETCFLLSQHQNVVVNLEGTAGYAYAQPRRFLESIGQMLQIPGVEDRIIWGTGCMGSHPRPLLEAFWNLEMPRDLVEGYGMPELTKEIKAKILGKNFARLHGLDLDTIAAAIPEDEFSGRSEFAEPWSRSTTSIPRLVQSTS